jgi:hypothetical protein
MVHRTKNQRPWDLIDQTTADRMFADSNYTEPVDEVQPLLSPEEYLLFGYNTTAPTDNGVPGMFDEVYLTSHGRVIYIQKNGTETNYVTTDITIYDHKCSVGSYLNIKDVATDCHSDNMGGSDDVIGYLEMVCGPYYHIVCERKSS